MVPPRREYRAKICRTSTEPATKEACTRLYADPGPISPYYANRTLLPAKTRAFVDFVLEAFKRDRLAERFAGSLD